MNLAKAMNILDLTQIPQDLNELRKKYYQKAKNLHPDKGGSNSEFNQLKEAYDFLKNPKKVVKPQGENKNSQSTQTSKSLFKQEYTFLTCIMTLFFVLIGYKISTYMGYTLLTKRNKIFILSKMPYSSLVSFKLKNYNKNVFVKKGWNKIDSNLYFFFD